MLNNKELGTIVFALEGYQNTLEVEGDIETRNYVIDLISKVCDMKGES